MEVPLYAKREKIVVKAELPENFIKVMETMELPKN
jgi:hypothetical protein